MQIIDLHSVDKNLNEALKKCLDGKLKHRQILLLLLLTSPPLQQLLTRTRQVLDMKTSLPEMSKGFVTD